MKAKARIYKGIEFVCVSDLPTDQQLLLEQSQQPERLKILIDGKITSNCIQYKDYSNWFTGVFDRSRAKAAALASAKEKAVAVEIALSKA